MLLRYNPCSAFQYVGSPARDEAKFNWPVRILPPGTVQLRIGVEQERRLSDHVYFPILPVAIECTNLKELSQVRFFEKFEHTYFKGLA